MKKLILFVFILSSLLANAQDSTKAKTKRFFYGVNFSPDYCYRTLVNNDGSDLSKTIVGIYNKIEIAKFGFTGGFNVFYSVIKNFNINFGLQYSNKGFQNKESDLTFGDKIDRRRGFVYSTNSPSISGKIRYTYNYIDIPLMAGFVFGKKKTRFTTNVGVTTNVLINSKNTFVGQDSTGGAIKNSSNTTSSYNRINFSPTISCGVEYKLNKTMFFRVEPAFRHGVLKMTDTPVTQYIWNAGINLSWYFL